jgi:hypothetical protein
MTEMLTYKFERDTEYPAGPWDNEPDKAQWIDEATGLDCLIVRNKMGSLCGYVGVASDHPWHGKAYSECMDTCERQQYDFDAMEKAGVPMPDSLKERLDDYTSCWDHSPEAKVSVHGGLTYSAACQEERVEGICHVPAPGRPHDIWWFGFDCGHYGDASPYDYKRAENKEYPWFPVDGEYRTIEYVQRECGELAQQLAAISSVREPMSS